LLSFRLFFLREPGPESGPESGPEEDNIVISTADLDRFARGIWDSVPAITSCAENYMLNSDTRITQIKSTIPSS
jgi:hypothetical protein